jgi:hypothetical protein
VELRAADGTACCVADLTQLTSAMLNLAINARAGFIAKPYRRAELARKLAEVMPGPA